MVSSFFFITLKEKMTDHLEKRKNFSDGTPYEEKVGYSRAVKLGNLIFVSGTTALNTDGTIVSKGDPYLQTYFIIKKIEQALIEIGASLDNVTRMVIYTTNIHYWEAIGKAHKKCMDKIRPATTMVEVSGLMHQDMLVEIEATAVI